MKRTFVGLVFMITLSMTTLLVQAQQSVAGNWTMSVQGMALHLEIAQTGEKVSGTLESPHGEIQWTGELVRGTLTLSGSSSGEHPVQFAGTATLAADGSLAGNISANQVVMNFTAVRSGN